MADTTKKVSELETASQVDSTDLVMLSQGSSQSGFASVKATILAIAQKIITGINFTSALETESKTIAGAINEVAQGGGGSGGHTIIDSDGNEMTARSGLQFENAYVSDDSADDKTVVPIYREMTRQEYSQAQDKTGLIVVTDDKAKVVNADSVYPVETSISEHAYSVGDHLIVDGVTYIVIDDIAIGDSLVEDTNIEAETIDDRLVSAIADNLTTDDSTKALSAKQGKVLNEKINGIEKVEIIPFTPSASTTVNSVVYKVGNNLLVISVDVTFSSVGGGWTEAFTISMQGKKCDGAFGTTYNGILVQAFGTNGIVVRLFAPSVNVAYRGFVVVPLQDM